MLSEMNEVKHFFGDKFGYGLPPKDGVYAIPTTTSKGDAFMRMEIKDGKPFGQDNFLLFWDEGLTVSWYDNPKPSNLKENDFVEKFRERVKIQNK